MSSKSVFFFLVVLCFVFSLRLSSPSVRPLFFIQILTRLLPSFLDLLFWYFRRYVSCVSWVLSLMPLSGVNPPPTQPLGVGPVCLIFVAASVRPRVVCALLTYRTSAFCCVPSLTCLSVCHACLSVLSVCRSVGRSVCLFFFDVCPSVWLVCPFVGMSVRPGAAWRPP